MFFFNSGILFREATRAFERTTAAKSDDEGNQSDALVAILFSAAALEAWINELALNAGACGMLFGTSRAVDVLGQTLDEAESSRGSTRLKYIIAKSVLTGEGYDKGGAPYQDFDLLFSLRDALIHMKPERIVEDSAGEERRTIRLVEGLKGRAACAVYPPKTHTTWTARIATRGVARWACNTAAAMVSSISSGLSSHVQDPVLVGFFAQQFHHVPSLGHRAERRQETD